MSEKKPFYHVENGENLAIINGIIQNDRPPIDDVEINEETKPIRAWIQQCWERRSEDRPTMKEMVTRLGINPLSYNGYMIRELRAILEEDFTEIPFYGMEIKE